MATTYVVGKTAVSWRTRSTPYLSASTMITDASRDAATPNAWSGVASTVWPTDCTLRCTVFFVAGPTVSTICAGFAVCAFAPFPITRSFCCIR
jgi:hypothetical protein